MVWDGFRNWQKGELARPGARSVLSPPPTLGATPHPAACALCPSGCGLRGWLREGELVHLEGDPEDPVNQGALCARGVAARALPRHPERLLAPRVRRPGADHWEQASWDQALEALALQLLRVRDEAWEGSAHRTEGLGFLGGGDLTREEVYLVRKLATHLGAPSCDHEARLGPVAAEWALRATLGHGGSSASRSQVEEARLVLVLGSDPAALDPMLFASVLRARSAGATLVVADSHLGRTGALADLFLAHRPGTLGALLMGLAHQVLEHERFDRAFLEERTDACWKLDPEFDLQEGAFPGLRVRGPGEAEYDRSSWGYQDGPEVGELEEEGSVFWHLRRHLARYDLKTVESLTGIRADRIERAAELLGSVRPGVALLGEGLTDHLNGVQQVRAAAVLQLLLGNLGVAGSGLHPPDRRAGTRGALELGGLWEELPGGLPPPGQWQVNLDEYQRVHGSELRQRLERLLRTWFEDELPVEDGYRLLPRVGREARYTLPDQLEAMWREELRCLVCVEADPAGGPLGGAPARASLRKLETLVVLDLFETETSEFWRREGLPEEIPTEVWSLPLASFLERGGSYRRPDGSSWEICPLVPPPGEARPAVQVLTAILQRIRGYLADQGRPRDRSLQRARCPDPERVLETLREELVELGDPLRAASPRFHLFAAAEPRGTGETGGPSGPLLRDGPFPEHYEPVEGPLDHPLHEGSGVSPLMRNQTGGEAWNETLDEQFPHFLVVGELPEAWGTGRLSSRLPLLREAMPGPLLEISRSLGRRLGIDSGDRVELATPRGAIEVPVARTDRLRPLYCSGGFVEVLWLSGSFPGLGGATPDLLEPSSGVPGSGVSRCRIRLGQGGRS